MFVESIEAIGTGLGVIEISEKLFPTAKKIFDLLKNGKLTIAIFGAGGTGKSTLGKILSGEFDLSGIPNLYQESILMEKYKLDSNRVSSIVVVQSLSDVLFS